MGMVMEFVRGARGVLDKRHMDTLILFVTSRCNFKCGTCFYWEKLNDHNDLTLDEMQRVAETTGHVSTLMLSGGEPFMRRELGDILRIFLTRNPVERVFFPTNGWFVDRVVEFARDITAEFPHVHFAMNMHLDGFQKTHDRIVAMPGSYEKVMECTALLLGLRRSQPNMSVNGITVVCRHNFDEMVEFGKFVYRELDLNDHIIQIARGSAPEEDIQFNDEGKLAELYEFVRHLLWLYTQKRKDGLVKNRFGSTGANMLTGFYQLGFRDFIYASDSSWPIPCMAGRTMGVLDHDGNVRVCELKEPIGNIRDFGYDFEKVWDSAALREERQIIKETRCSCTHLCFVYNSLYHSVSSYLVRAPLEYLKAKKRFAHAEL